MTVQRRHLLDDGVDVRNGDQNLGSLPGHGFGNCKLVEVARIVIVDGAPGKVPEVAHRFLNRRGGSLDCVEFGECLGRELGFESPFEHRPMRYRLQDRAMLSVAGIRYHVTFLWYPLVIA